MMRTYHDHEDDEYLDVRTDMHHNNVFHGYINNGPDPRYYHNAPRSDEGHINTSSDECNTSYSMPHHSPDHSPKCNAAVATTTVVHDNERDCFDDERDAPEEEDFDYREDEYYTTDEQESHWQGSYLTHHNHPVPAFCNGEGTHVFVPVDGPPHGYYHHGSHHPDGHYYHHQPSFPDPRNDIYHQHHVYGHQQQHPSHPLPPAEYASAPFQHEEHANDPGYYTNAFDAPLPEQVQNAPPPPPQENVDPPTGATREYRECDVLCGRGALMIWHPGNQYFRSLVQKHRQRYFFSRRQEKKKIASQIIDGVREAGGRFLRRSQASDGLNEINVWVEIDEERAYQKCCQALREGAPDIRRQWRNKPDVRSTSNVDESKENDDNAASR